MTEDFFRRVCTAFPEHAPVAEMDSLAGQDNVWCF